MTLQYLVFVLYLAVAFLGLAVAIRAIGVRRYYPIVLLLGLGYGVPAIGLAVIRGARLAHIPGSESVHTMNTILVISFVFTLGSLVHAWILIGQEIAVNPREL